MTTPLNFIFAPLGMDRSLYFVVLLLGAGDLPETERRHREQQGHAAKKSGWSKIPDLITAHWLRPPPLDAIFSGSQGRVDSSTVTCAIL